MLSRLSTNVHNKYDTSALYFVFDTYVPNDQLIFNAGYWRASGNVNAWNGSSLQAVNPLQGNRVINPQTENAYNNDDSHLFSNLLPYDLSVSCWVRSSDQSWYSNDHLFSFFNNGDQSNRYFVATMSSTTNLRILYKDGTTAQTYNFTVNSIYADTNWHNFCFTLDSTTISVYQDGSYVGNTTYTPLSTSYPFNKLWGCYNITLPGGPGRACKLHQDAFRVYPKLITASHIAHIWEMRA